GTAWSKCDRAPSALRFTSATGSLSRPAIGPIALGSARSASAPSAAERTSGPESASTSIRGGTARGSPKCPSDRAAAARTPAFSSFSRATRARTTVVSWLELAAREPVERLEEEAPLDQAGAPEPQGIAPRQMSQLVRQHAALLLGAELGERQLGHADLGETQGYGTRDGSGHREVNAAPVSGGALQFRERRGERSVAHEPAVGQPADQDQPSRHVIEGRAERDRAPQEHNHQG